MQEGKTTLQFTGKQTSEISSKMSHKLASLHLKPIPLCALAVTWALGDLGRVVLGQPPPATLPPAAHPAQLCKLSWEDLKISPDGYS